MAKSPMVKAIKWFGRLTPREKESFLHYAEILLDSERAKIRNVQRFVRGAEDNAGLPVVNEAGTKWVTPLDVAGYPFKIKK